MLKTFPVGGIHPPENKITTDKAIVVLPLPATVAIPVSQHIGAPANVIVSKGDYVKTGQVIANSKGFISANIHSSVSGKVNRIDSVIDSTGYRQSAVIIDVEGDEWIETIDRTPDINRNNGLASEDIIKKCLEAGIVGLGGATFPSHVKLSVPQGKKCEILLINGVECEPYLTSDHRLMLEKGDEILTGITLLMKALNVTKAMIGIENNKPDAVAHLSQLASSYQGISVHALKVKYPQGAEKQLIKALVNREVPSGKLPIDIGVVVHNVGTAFAVYEAVQKNKPLFERVVTITGKSLSNPGNYLVRIGTPVSKLIEAAGGIPADTGKIVSGGPMMGKALNNTEVPVVKGTSGIILFPEKESARSEVTACIRCAKCTFVCALNLEPFLLATLSEKGMYERAEKEHITDCMECGSCSYTCPAGRPLLDYIRLGKSTVSKMIRQRNIKQ
ncbi:MAG TPA: electron transport complex subunit RsxC [Bacteroidales bacterium]|nr:electron transport complex subunit RsxC [Bacteroidales bacterium]